MPLVTRMFASSEHAWDPMASSSVNFCRKTRTVPVSNPGHLQCLDAIYGGNGKRQWTSERYVIGRTHASVSSEQAWEPTASSSVNVCRKTSTVHFPEEAPSELRHHLQCQPVRKTTRREKWHWSHAWQCFKRTSKGVNLNGILECKMSVLKPAHVTLLQQAVPLDPPAVL
jgi:hypothetical protein